MPSPTFTGPVAVMTTAMAMATTTDATPRT
jgi:hypothetical protein